MRDFLADESAEQREARLQLMDRLAAESAEQREAKLQHMIEQMRDLLTDESLEQREVRLQQMSDSVKEWLLRLSSYVITFHIKFYPFPSFQPYHYHPLPQSTPRRRFGWKIGNDIHTVVLWLRYET